MVHRMTNLVFQLAIIIFAARAGGLLFEKIGLPSVLGELAAGIIIGPYLLGGISLPGFEQGFFPLPGSVLPISPELYGIAVIASIILLFMAGLETDIELFIRYSITGSVVGIGGIVFAYLIGSLTGMFFFDLSFMDPKCMFLGVMSTTTSVGISARILSERRSMDSPEGVTILSGAVIDDVLGIILLAIVLGISLMMPGGGNGGGTVAWGNIGLIALKAFGVWLGFTAAGFFLAHYVSSFLKLFKNRFVFSILAFGLALFLAGIFEKAGLAMIIGAYVMGISLSKTDICDVLQDTLQPIEVFFVPVFFTVMGMMVDVKTFASLETILFGLLYAAGAIFAKVIGCGGPSLFLGFNRLGAARIGFGMAPRGEVALIIGGIGLSYGILNEQLFGGLIMMMLISAIVVPPVLDRLLKKREKGTTREPKRGEIITTSYSLPSQEHSELLVSYIVEYFKKKGFFVNTMKLDTVIYQVRKDDIFIKFFYHPVQVIFKTTERDVPIVKTIVDESFLRLYDTINALQALAPRDLRRHIASATECRRDIDIVNILSPVSIIMNLQSGTKEGAIKELVEVLEANGKLLNKKKILKEVLARERIMSTGMEDGLAIPHARSNGVASVCMALGIHRAGIDFESFDEKPSHIIMLFVSSMSEKDPHLYLLSEIAIFVNSEETKNTLLGLKTVKEVHDFFRER
ncbi:MAG: PTS transporter subunit EIIA [bacterium]|nr:PTS transporter subunit EIIA [bacterium]